MTALLPTAYLGSLQYYSILANYPVILFEKWEYYEKQTCRNRCTIYNPNGRLNLIVPIQHVHEAQRTDDGGSDKMLIKDVKISYSEDWQKQHWKSLESSYRSSPYFEYYEDDFYPFYHNRYPSLFEFNEAIQNCVLSLLGLKIKSTCTSSYREKYPDTVDYRDDFGQKKRNAESNSPHYIKKIKITDGSVQYSQIFDTKHGFIPNLSILDLLFNQGPAASEYLVYNSDLSW